MIGSVPARRRANAFAEALEQSAQERTAERTDPPTGAPETEEPFEGQGRLSALARELGEVPTPQLDPEVKTVQRAQLVAAMEQFFAEGAPRVPEQAPRPEAPERLAPLSRLRPRSRWARGLVAGGLTAGVAAGAFGGVAAASSDALPGDSLYGFKRGIEDVRLGLTSSEDDRGELLLSRASTRLQEVRQLMERRQSAGLDEKSLGEIRRALAGMRHDASEGHRLLHEVYEHKGSITAIEKLNAFSSKHRSRWSRLREELPAQLTDVRDGVSSVFEAIDQEVRPLKSLLAPRPEEDGTPHTGVAGAPNSLPSHLENPGDREPTVSNPPGGQPEDADGTPEPAESGRSGKGLIGGAGDLLPSPPDVESDAPGSEEKAGKSSETTVTLPPLLPGLLPRLGLDAQDFE
ncbi:DUF5667 domain-containing protein [Streptomyces sp. TP-A0874]|uniref:DUF5667 domain-containing protein n=1 Tax=Streptomyces sp. TP-A0874 TaxID=549819 RepID=UPI0008537D10|nr:DUF5667 domain-containing protein [Streptomyces sp. TP-A0874]